MWMRKLSITFSEWPTTLEDSGRRGVQCGEVKEEAAKRAGDTNGAECHVGLSPLLERQLLA